MQSRLTELDAPTHFAERSIDVLSSRVFGKQDPIDTMQSLAN